MSRLRDALHDAWCAITGCCGRNQATRTDTMGFLKEQQDEALRRVSEAEERIHRVNMLERRLVPHLRGEDDTS